MRLVTLLYALAIASSVAACGGKAKPAPDDEDSADSDDGPFTAKTGYKPTAFTVDVRGDGRPVIFIPGLACPGAVWDDTVERLDAAVEGGIQAHVITLAGFAGTEPIRPPLSAKARKQLVRYIRSRKLEKPVVIGHSMGGFLAYWLATTSSHALGGVVVVDAGPALSSGEEDDARRLRNVWAQAGDDEIPVRVRTVYSYMVRDIAKLEPYFDDIARSDPKTIGDAIYEMVKTDLREDLESINVPTLLVLADGGLQHGFRKMAAAVPDLEVVVVRKARHFVMIDEPDAFTRAVATFIAKLDE